MVVAAIPAKFVARASVKFATVFAPPCGEGSGFALAGVNAEAAALYNPCIAFVEMFMSDATPLAKDDGTLAMAFQTDERKPGLAGAAGAGADDFGANAPVRTTPLPDPPLDAKAPVS